MAILSAAIAMAGGWAHLLELRNEMILSSEDYRTVQQIDRGWSLPGIPVVGALISTVALTWLERDGSTTFHLSVLAAGCIAVSLVLFSFTFPANQATGNWTVLPEGWEALRRQREYWHAAAAILDFVALASLVLAVISSRR